ncbi:MAG: hypothetical protein HQL22_07260 [Candidatus Omnitrophica bacterium]|nr:hypothetical protein [Candidatus Omnitrophota bacterium]
MSSSKSHLEAVRTLGVIAGQARRGLAGFWETFQQTRSKIGISLLSREDIRKIVSEEVPRVSAEQHELSLQEHERRLKAMSEALLALQEKIGELQKSGRLNEQTMSQAVSAIEHDEHFSDDERNILATILKQNLVLQKPEALKKEKDS